MEIKPMSRIGSPVSASITASRSRQPRLCRLTPPAKHTHTPSHLEDGTVMDLNCLKKDGMGRDDLCTIYIPDLCTDRQSWHGRLPWVQAQASGTTSWITKPLCDWSGPLFCWCEPRAPKWWTKQEPWFQQVPRSARFRPRVSLLF